MSLDLKTLFVGKKFIYLSTVDSTNNYAANLISRSNVPDGTVIMADFQEEGRGQRGKSWQSDPEKNLMFSVIFKPGKVSVGDQFLISKVVSLGLVTMLSEEYDLEAYIKWPNDIVVGQKKLSGILIENSLRSGRLTHSIVGIGFNVNQKKFPDVIPACALSSLVEGDPDRMDVLEYILFYIEKWYLQLNAGHYDRIDREYWEKLLFAGEKVEVQIGGEKLTVLVKGVQRDGGILLEKEGEERPYYLGEVKLPGYDLTSTNRSAM